MRIAYVGRWREEPPDGVCLKVRAQEQEWRRHGHEVQLFGLPLAGYGRQGNSPGAIARSVAATVRLRRAVRRFAPDVVYARYGLYVPSLRGIQRRFVTVVELNARSRTERTSVGGLPRRALDAAVGAALVRRADGLVCVARAVARDVEDLGIPVRVIANGARLDGVTPASSHVGERPVAAFLAGAPMPWHGLDKLLHLAREVPEWDFELIGVDESALPAPAAPNVRTHPPMSREDYSEVLAGADVGIGSLAMHRAGLDEASPLKVREYLAHGLPVIVSFEDTDLGDEPWFVLRLPNTEENVRQGLGDIRRFVEAIRGRRVAPGEVTGLDLRAKEAERLEFMAALAEPRG